MRLTLAGCVLLFAAQAFGQVRVDARVEKTTYLQGEPIFVIVDVSNIGDDAVGYSTCGQEGTLRVVGVEKRTPPNIFGCFSGIGSGAGFGCGTTHLPSLMPGQKVSSRYLLKGYDLEPGQHALTASGKAGVRWQQFIPTVRPAPSPKHEPTDPVAGAQFETTLPLTIVRATEDQLRRVFAPLVSDADAADAFARYEARAAIVEAAPVFLTSLIGRFASEDQFGDGAIDALVRIATSDSRRLLKTLFMDSTDRRRPAIALALARIGSRDDTEFFGDILLDAKVDDGSKPYAALGLARAAGDAAVPYLERALAAASPGLRPSLATALGNTHSPLAVPILIDMFGNNAVRSDVCAAFETLTHRVLCDGTADDPAAIRRRQRRWWNDTRSSAPLFGPDSCPVPPAAPEHVARPLPVVERPKQPGIPRISSIVPAVASPNTVIAISGDSLGLGEQDLRLVRVLFSRDGEEHVAPVTSTSGDLYGRMQFMDVVVPRPLTPGRWQVVVDANGRRTAAATLDITSASDVRLSGILPARVHPAQFVFLTTTTQPEVDDQVELRDARGTLWSIPAGVSSRGIAFVVPDDVADGEASARVGKSVNGIERFGPPLQFVVTSGPLPLNPTAVALMKPVAPRQWTDLAMDWDVEFEVRRVDRIDFEFRQRDAVVVTQTVWPGSAHVQVPASIAPGRVSVRTRTWIEQTASEWSAPATFRVLRRPVAPSIDVIEAGPGRDFAWASGYGRSAFVDARQGEPLVLRGHLPVARAADLRIQLIRGREVFDLAGTDLEGGVRIEIPARLATGDWRLVVGTNDRRVPRKEVTRVQVR